MKKWLALMFVSAFVGSIASAQYLVYDYKASIKRLDDQLAKTKYSPSMYDGSSKIEVVWDSYTAVSDGLKGYLLVPVCIGCNEEEGMDSSLENEAWIIVMRKGDKTKGVWKMPALVSSAIFKKGLGARAGDEEQVAYINGPLSLQSMMKGTEAWMAVDFEIPLVDDLEGPTKFGYFSPYGLLGMGSLGGDIWQTGFGNAKSQSETISGVCGYVDGTSCMVVNNINGTLVGYTEQGFICALGIWDLCFNPYGDGDGAPLADESIVPYGVVSGSWSVKLNAKLSAQYASEGDELLYNKLSGKYWVEDGYSSGY